ncbi:glutamine ABC transporter permease [Mycolicibacterium agri]|uniref:Glutamine ABC transporter permease n=1 Tax=Mycolicibacterium agri TaxID=36811 RepID=A0A2A7MR85_MYCAG|nr:ABC transporter permease [Mycolicibacterium agri]PEG34079.1 glutamine ABC transporter permease [Mycolicibacterium agri]GFG49241.1 putative ABC transporter permease [Mycolicibacterium agri]
MLRVTLRDLQWRRRRFLIAIVGTSLVFAMTLVLTGLSNGFRVEANQTADALGFDTYLVRTGPAGPFIGSPPFPQSEVTTAARLPGVTAAVPLVYTATTVPDGDSTRNVNVFGAPAQGPGMPPIASGRAPAGAEEAAVSSTLGVEIGDDIEIGSSAIRIVGIVDDSTALAGQPNVFLTVAGAQQMGFNTQPIVTSIGIRGTPAAVPDGYRIIDRAGAVADLMRPMTAAVAAITMIAVLLWVVAALIVGSVIYLSALERTRDFAVLKAVGVSTPSVLAGLCLQAVIVAVVAALLGGLLSLVLAPVFPMRVEVPTSAFLLLPLIGVAVGLLASAAGMRRAVTIDPALAFGGP